MNSKDKARLEELETEECLVDDEDIIDYFRLSCEKLREENQELQSKYDSLLRIFELQIEAKEKLLDERIKYIEAIEQAIELLSVDGKGTKQEVKKMLSEVLGNVD